jgi:hypothetical protein
LEELPEDPAGKQIMALFKFGGFGPFEDHYLDTIRALRERHDALAKELARNNGKAGAR